MEQHWFRPAGKLGGTGWYDPGLIQVKKIPGPSCASQHVQDNGSGFSCFFVRIGLDS